MAAMPPSKAQVRREKERRSLGNELTGRRKKKARIDEVRLHCCSGSSLAGRRR